MVAGLEPMVVAVLVVAVATTAALSSAARLMATRCLVRFHNPLRMLPLQLQLRAWLHRQLLQAPHTLPGPCCHGAHHAAPPAAPRGRGRPASCRPSNASSSYTRGCHPRGAGFTNGASSSLVVATAPRQVPPARRRNRTLLAVLCCRAWGVRTCGAPNMPRLCATPCAVCAAVMWRPRSGCRRCSWRRRSRARRPQAVMS